MQFRRSFIATGLAAALAILPIAAPVVSAQGQSTQPLNIPIVQTLSGIGTFTGNLAVNSFSVVNGQIQAVGTLTGRITDTAGNLLGTIATAVTVPITATGTCDILHLTLGPLDLNLLGLQVHLDRVVLDITAQAGPGNLLGNLLCSVANLLNGNGPLGQLAAALNNLLRAL